MTTQDADTIFAITLYVLLTVFLFWASAVFVSYDSPTPEEVTSPAR